MDEKDSVEIKGENSKIEVKDVKDVEVKGDNNIINVEGDSKIEIKGKDNIIGKKSILFEGLFTPILIYMGLILVGLLSISKTLYLGIPLIILSYIFAIGYSYYVSKKNNKNLTLAILFGFFLSIVAVFYYYFNDKEYSEKRLKIIKNKKFQKILLISLFLIILITGVWIRTQNIPLLKDSTSGKNIPLALDPYYFLRIAETTIQQGHLPQVDTMRYPALHAGFSQEILPQVLVFMHKTLNLFGKYTIGYIDVIYPVVFFALGLIAFFFLIYFLTKSKTISLISSGFLAFIPSYLYRTMAGFADHEAIGMFSVFLVLLAFVFALKFLSKKEKSLIKAIGLGVLVGFLTTFSIVSWGGGAVFIYQIIPFSFLIFWLVNYKEKDKYMLNSLIFYIAWAVFSIFFGVLFKYNLSNIIARYYLSSYGLVGLGILGFMIIDYLLSLGKIKINQDFRQVYSFAGVFVLGIIGLILIGKSPFELFSSLWGKLIHPFGTGRVGLTVAENAQPYLIDWINQTGKIIFWFFYFGSIFIGIEISKGIRGRLSKISFSLLWILMISSILFSRISSSSFFNGDNLISQLFYIFGVLLFVYYAVKIYFKKEIKIKPELIIILAWMLSTLISGRSAIRVFFAITPFVCFGAGFFIVKLYDYYKESKDDLLKMILGVSLIIVLVFALLSFSAMIKATSQSAKYTGPSANSQWQKAMAWVRENTPENSIFVHWWDYGYWVEYLGQRTSITDGGHYNGYWDHLIGRYLLTTPYPETALSFMKTHNVSYLLIDPTDLGKYPAYSSIGSDNNNDRYSGIISMVSNPKQIQETAEGEKRIFQGTFGVEDDTVYDYNGTEIFLPGPTYNEMNKPEYKSYVIGVILNVIKNNQSISFRQPEGIFVYNGNQYKIPLRYLYFNKKIYDFKTGFDSGIRIIPAVFQIGGKIQIDPIGALIYLSPRTLNSLVGQLYVLNNAMGKYKGVELVHEEESPYMQGVNSYGNEFLYFRGIQGPIKIWKITPPENIIAREEFLRPSGKYAEFDNLTFINKSI